MDAKDADPILEQTLADHRMSRSERKRIAQLVADKGLDDNARAFWRSRVFSLAERELESEEARAVLSWVEEAVKALIVREPEAKKELKAYFSPGTACREAIQRQLRTCQKTADICVFTITDNHVSREILEAHQRGVIVRIISDDDKSLDRGSDLRKLEAEGVQVRTDASEHHMHHKFAVFDRRIVLTGSYNWTRSAADHNRENVLVVKDATTSEAYLRVFETLWKQFTPIV